MANIKPTQNSLDLPFIRSFSGHETFPFRSSWLKKGVDWVNKDPSIFQHEDAVVKFGVGKNMVQSIRHWCIATRVVEDLANGDTGLRSTLLGNKLFTDDGWDPYLEDDASLWLLHWNLSSKGTRAATWYWAFNQFSEFAFTRHSMSEALLRDINNGDWAKVSESTIKRDIDCFILTYLPRRDTKTDIEDAIGCPLTGLKILLQEPDSDRTRFNVGPKESLPSEIFAFALCEFWIKKNHGGKTLDLREIMRSEGSPSTVFKLDQDSVLAYLDQLEKVTGGKIKFQDTPLVRQVINLVLNIQDPLCLLENYYGHG